MPKRAIGILYVIAIILGVVAVGYFSVTLQSYNNDVSNLQFDQTQLAQEQAALGPTYPGSETDQEQVAVDQNHVTYDKTLISDTSVFIVLASIPGGIAWIGALINLSRAREWVWFVLMFFFGEIVLLIYLIGGPEPPKAGQYLQSQQWTGYPSQQTLGGTPSQISANLMYQPSALELLQQRFVRGEIDATTFEQMREQLRASERSD